tara:strand:- start:709 stop:1098 length:390 start_codon:yes stop_codon:yes gene_type:complete
MQEIRECGDCKECCTLLEIPTLQKPPRKKCEKLCQEGCSIYSSRPTECRTFQCFWSEGYLSESARPDRSGIMAYHIDSQFGNTLLILELKPKAFRKKRKHKEKMIQFAESRSTPIIMSDIKGKATAMLP